MGDRQQELEASCELIVRLAEHHCGDDLRSDVDYGKQLVLAAPDLLELAELVERSTADTFTVHASLIEIINEKARSIIAKAKGE